MTKPTRLYTAVIGSFLLLQGVSTLMFRLIPALDKVFPQLLSVTQMVPTHSALHILTGLLALFLLFRGGEKGCFWFAVGFGAFYTILALYGFFTHMPTMFQLQSFDHPVHLALGSLGLLATAVHIYLNRKQGLL